MEGDLDDEAKLGAIKSDDNVMASGTAWKTAQSNNRACSVAIKLLNSGKPPPKATGKTAGEYWNDVRKYVRDATVASNSTLVVKTPPSEQSGNIDRERIVIPKNLTPALLYHMHNHLEMHPSKTQKKHCFKGNTML